MRKMNKERLFLGKVNSEYYCLSAAYTPGVFFDDKKYTQIYLTTCVSKKLGEAKLYCTDKPYLFKKYGIEKDQYSSPVSLGSGDIGALLEVRKIVLRIKDEIEEDQAIVIFGADDRRFRIYKKFFLKHGFEEWEARNEESCLVYIKR